MGRLVLVGRLLLADLRRRRLQAGLFVVIVVVTSTTLMLALTLRTVSAEQFSRTRAATRGPDVVAQLGFAPGGGRPSPDQFAPLLHAPGVRATNGPYPLALVSLRAAGNSATVYAEGRDAGRGMVDRPVLSQGGWVTPGHVVIERGLAAALGLHVGDRVRLNGQRVTVGGVAYTTARPFYPARAPGLVWLTRTDVMRLTGRRPPAGYMLNIALRDPASAFDVLSSAAVTAFARETITRNEPSLVEPWPLIRDQDYKLVRLDRKVLLVGSLLLIMLATASIAVLVGGRMAQQTRRVGLLKAIGATPGLVAAILLAENLLLTAGAAAAGVIAAAVIVPSLADPGQGLIGAQANPPVTAEGIIVTLAVALGVSAISTVVPAIRAARTSTVGSLRDTAQPPRRHAWLIALSARVPTELLLGLRLVARRIRRTALTGAGLLVAVATVVTALAVHQNLHVADRRPTPIDLFNSHGVDQQANHVLVLLSVLLVALAAITVTFTAWATVIDAQRSTALARALGATPRQVSSGLITAQLLAALPAACLGIPAGLLLYAAAGGHLSEAPVPVAALLAVIPVTLLAVAAVSAVPVRLAARRSVAEVLRAD